MRRNRTSPHACPAAPHCPRPATRLRFPVCRGFAAECPPARETEM